MNAEELNTVCTGKQLKKTIFIQFAFCCYFLLQREAEERDIFPQRTLIKMGVISVIDFCSPASCFLCVTLGIEWLMHAASYGAFGTLLSESFITYFCISF